MTLLRAALFVWLVLIPVGCGLLDWLDWWQRRVALDRWLRSLHYFDRRRLP